LIVDDSALMRQLLTAILESDPLIEVIGAAPDPYVAREKIKQLNPDVLTLDVEMPRMDGLAFLRNIMRLRPMPVVMCSSLTQRGAEVTLEALTLGAVDFVAKPALDAAHSLKEVSQEIIDKVKAAAKAKVRALVDPAMMIVEQRYDVGVVIEKRNAPSNFLTTDRVIAIGASTGGTEAIKEVLAGLPADVPGIVITQHIPKAFSGPFARRLNDCCALKVCEAEDGQTILPGHVYIAPGDEHLLVNRSGARYYCELNDGPKVNRHKPSVDVLFRSVAQAAGRNSIGVILTGMGDDGAKGMLEMRSAGAPTLAQDEASSVVWGMPGAAWQAGGVQSLHPLLQIAARIVALAGA
jgi:two-component system, chemotaxis family, protein-glutamate methylesterase/glutaminase